ncbi:MAG: nucleotide exchange factor GrpE, partial [Spirochaetaceae bacterium]|nr:nucleotide exchange factor GrpE [Spirochaetaceae bacterium]
MGERTRDKTAGERELGDDQNREDGFREPELSAGEAEGRAGETPQETGTENAGANTEAGGLSPEQRIADLETQLAELSDQYLRKVADFENYRKRMNREKQDAIDFANQSLIADLIPIIDDFERAIKAAEAARTASSGGDISKDFTALYEGISMTEKRLLTQLENRWGVKRYD